MLQKYCIYLDHFGYKKEPSLHQLTWLILFVIPPRLWWFQLNWFILIPTLWRFRVRLISIVSENIGLPYALFVEPSIEVCHFSYCYYQNYNNADTSNVNGTQTLIAQDRLACYGKWWSTAACSMCVWLVESYEDLLSFVTCSGCRNVSV